MKGFFSIDRRGNLLYGFTVALALFLGLLGRKAVENGYRQLTL